MRAVPALSIGANVVAAGVTAVILWFGLLSPPHAYHLQPDGTWQVTRDVGADAKLVAIQSAPFLVLALLAWCCRRSPGTSRGILVTTLAVAALGIAVSGWEASRPWSTSRGLFTAIAWVMQCLIVAGAAAVCMGSVFGRPRPLRVNPAA